MKAKTQQLVSLIEAIYVVFMLNFFKTNYNFETDPDRLCLMGDMQHPYGRTEVATSKVCPFGNKIGWVFGGYLVLRNIVKVSRTVNYIVLAIGAALSLLNKNVLVYLIPVFLFEIFT